MRVRRLSGLSVNRMVPNVLTLLALCAGMTAIRFAMNGNFDGSGLRDHRRRRVRRARRPHRPAAELDLAASAPSSTACPISSASASRRPRCCICGRCRRCTASAGRSCCSSRCAARLRLARFNTQSAAEPAALCRRVFQRRAGPGGAGLVMMPLFLSFEWGDWVFRSPYLNAVMDQRRRVVDGQHGPDRFAEADPHPASSGRADLARHRRADRLSTTAPWPTLTVVGVVYIGSIPLTIRAYYRLRRAHEAKKPETPAAASLPLPGPVPFTEERAPSPEWRH